MFRSPLTLDRANAVSTAIVTLLLVVLVAVVWATGARGGQAVAWLLAATLGVCFAMSPRALVVEGGEVRVERRMWPALRIPLSEIERAAPLTSLGKGVLRVGGVGGFFGSFGFFRSSNLGRFRLYATRGGQAVIIRRKGALPVVVTPDDVAGAIAAIDRRPLLTR